jgi:hypothetical protein
LCRAHGNHIVLLLGGYGQVEAPRTRRQNEEARARLKRWKTREERPVALMRRVLPIRGRRAHAGGHRAARVFVVHAQM